MRPAALLLAVLVLGVAGCGGEDVGYEEVPGPPAALEVPQGSDALSANASPTPTATSTETADPNAAATTAPTAVATATPAAQGGGAGAPNENEFDAFCNENPGACD